MVLGLFSNRFGFMEDIFHTLYIDLLGDILKIKRGYIRLLKDVYEEIVYKYIKIYYRSTTRT